MEKYSFECGRWLDINEDDNEIVRELPATGAPVNEPLPCKRHPEIYLRGAENTNKKMFAYKTHLFCFAF